MYILFVGLGSYDSYHEMMLAASDDISKLEKISSYMESMLLLEDLMISYYNARKVYKDTHYKFRADQVVPHLLKKFKLDLVYEDYQWDEDKCFIIKEVQVLCSS